MREFFSEHSSGLLFAFHQCFAEKQNRLLAAKAAEEKQNRQLAAKTEQEKQNRMLAAKAV